MNSARAARRARLAVTLACFGSCLPALAQEADRPAEWAPADAVFYVGCPDVHGLVEAGKKTILKDYFEDPKLEKERAAMFEGLGGMSDDFFASGFGVEDIEELELGKLEAEKLYPHGAACFFATMESAGKGDSEPIGHVQLVAEMGKNYGQLRELVEKLTEKLQDRKARRETTRFRGTSIVSLFPRAGDFDSEGADEDADEGDDEKKPEPYVYAFHKKFFLLGNDVDLTKQTLRRMAERRTDCLAANSGYSNLSRTCDPVGPLRMFVNLPRIFKLLGDADKDDARIFTALGLPAWKPLTATMHIGQTRGALYSVQMNLPLGSTDKGLGKILAMKNRPVLPPRYIDADTAMLMAWNVAPGEVFDEYLAITERIDPNRAKEIRANLDVAWGDDDEKVNVRNDLIDVFEGPFTLSVALKKPHGPNSIRLLATIAHKNRAALEKLFNKLTGGMFEKRDMLGQQVYDIKLPMLMGQGAAMAITERLCVAGSGTSIASAIRAEKSETEGLGGEEAFKSIAKLVPEDAWLTIFYDSHRLNRFMSDLLKSQTSQGEEAASTGDVAEDELSQSIAQFLSMLLMRAAADTETLEASLKYNGLWILTAATRNESLDIRVVGCPPKTDKK